MTDIQIFEPDGRAIPYAVEGEGAALVLIAGQGLNISYLGVLADAIATEDLRVIRVGSRRPAADASVSVDDLAQDVVDLLDHLAIADAWVGGHAFGGSIARTVSLTHPDRVNGVLLLGVEEAAGQDALDAEEIPPHVRDAEVEAMHRSARQSWQPAALAPGVPVLVVQGTQDPVDPPVNGERLQEAAPDRVSVVRIDGGGYLFPATHVGATSWAIEDYLDWD